MYYTKSWHKIYENLLLAWTRTMKAYKSDEVAESKASNRLRAIRDLETQWLNIQTIQAAQQQGQQQGLG